MKKILPFKLFESSDDDIKKGFKFSEKYIRDRIYYLTDIGFSLDHDKIDSLYINDSGGKVRLIDATKSVYFLKLTRNLDYKLKYRSVKTGSYPISSKTYYYLNNTEDLLELAEEVASFSAHFDDIYHNITYDSKSIEISFYIYSEISNDVKENEKSDIINSKVRDRISDSIYNFSRKFSDTKIGLTKKFKQEAQKDKLGESSYGFIGGKGFKIKVFNTDGLTKSVINTNFRRIENIVAKSSWNIPEKFHKIEFRKINENDIEKLKNSIDNEKVTIQYLSDRYLELDAIILDIDYDSWFESYKKDIEDNFEEYMDRERRRYYW